MVQQALQYLGIVAPHRYDRPPAVMAMTRQEHRELAARMRALPGRFADRLSASALARINVAARSGRWEEAVDELLTCLRARAEAITDAERGELREVMAALGVDGGRVEGLLQRH
ncbi:hypothetical protein GCM10029978_046800 [Actinoallomurus acanthiterrae]